MIFVVVGTHEQPFDRLIQAVDALAVGETCFVQTGCSVASTTHAESAAYLEFEEVRRRMIEADVVITHAGTGSVMLALSLGKHPVVAPRYAHLREHVDDHQLQLVAALEARGLITTWREGESLADAVAVARAAAQGGRKIEPDVRLVSALRAIIDDAARERRRSTGDA